MSESKELTVPERAAVALGAPKYEQEIRDLVAKTVTITEVKNKDGREQCHGAMMTLKNTRVAIEKAAKAAREDATAFSKAVIAEEKRLVALAEPEEARLQGLRDAWDAEIEREKAAKAAAEKARVDAIRAKIDEIKDCVVVGMGRSSDELESAISELESTEITLEEYGELSGEAQAAQVDTVAKLKGMLVAQLALEVEQARLAAEREAIERQRAELAERERKAAAARADEERKAREAREAEDALVDSIWKNARRIEFNSAPYIRKAIATFESAAKDWGNDPRPRVSGAIASAREEMQMKLQSAEEAAERERVEAEQRAAQEKSAAELRAQQEAHAKLVREQQAEIARQQAAIDAERQRQADEAARVEREKQAAIAAEAARVAAEERRKREEAEAAAQKVERERIERERAENLAARYAQEPTGGTWSVGKTGGCIVTTEAIGGAPGSGHNDVEYYGGNLICESVWRPADAHLLAAARDMLEALRRVQLSTEWSCMESEIQDAITAALAKAEYIPTEAVELKAA